MRERTAVAIGIFAGALAGGTAAWLLFTRDGRRLREELEPRLLELAEQALELRESARRLQAAAFTSWGTMHDIAGEPPEH